MRVFRLSAMKFPFTRLCRVAFLAVVAAAALGFYIGVNWSTVCKFPTNLDVCHERTSDVDFLRENARLLEEAALQLKVSAADGEALRALLTVQRVISRLDPRRALSVDEQLVHGVASAPDACGEEFKGGRYGLPYYRDGFVPAPDCRRQDKPPLRALLTALLLVPPAAEAKVPPGAPPDAPFAPLRARQPLLPAVVAVASGRSQAAHAKTTVVSGSEREWAAPGALLNRLVAQAHTPYVLLARDAVRVDELARLERLIYVISSLSGNAGSAGGGVGGWGVALAGGAVRDPVGRWNHGCAETRLRNYALRVRRGYRYSALDCMLCDTLRGPFVVRTSLLREVTFDERLPAAVVFEDWFLRVKRRGALAAACPDSLFFVSGAAEGVDGLNAAAEGAGGRVGREAWRQLAAAWQVDSVHLPGRQPLRFSCDEISLSCDLKALNKRGMLIPTCCLGEVADALAAYDDFATRHNLPYELNEGTTLGAAKLRSVLPWDIDGDIIIHYDDFEKYKEKKTEMAELGYVFEQFTEKDGFKYFSFRTPHVTIDMWCRNKLGTFLLPEEMQNFPTRMKIMGIWMRSPWNPGLVVRNRYGPGYLKHAQHWTKLGLKNHMGLYSVGAWGNCSLPNHHACLNRYPAEGSFNVLPEDCSVH